MVSKSAGAHTHTHTHALHRIRERNVCLDASQRWNFMIGQKLFSIHKRNQKINHKIKTNYVMFHLLKWKNINIRNSFSRNWNKVQSTKVNENKHKKYLKKSQEFLLCTKVISDQTTGGNVNW